MNDQKTTLPADVIINGGKSIPVTLKDGSTQSVTVMLVPLSKAMRYVQLIDELTAFVEFATGQKEGWADTLSEDSVYELDTLAKELNDPRIDRFLTRQKKTVERMAPLARGIRAAAAGSTSS